MKAKPVAVLSRPFPDAFVSHLTQIVEARVFDQEDPAIFDGVTVYCSTATNAVTASLIAQFPESVRLIANFGVGIDHIDLRAARARSIAVSNTPVVTEDTADLAWSLLLATCRRLNRAEQLLRAGQWNGAIGPEYFGQRVHGKVLGIVGLGAIGTAVARRAIGFNMQVIYHGPNPKPEVAQRYGLRYCKSLEDLLQQADIVTLHSPLLPQTRHLLNRATLAAMKSSAILINTGRGALIDEQALLEALQAGQLGAAGLDVFEFEPKVTEGLLNLPNVTLLPHIGSATGECRHDMALRMLRNMQHFFAHGIPLDPV